MDIKILATLLESTSTSFSCHYFPHIAQDNFFEIESQSSKKLPFSVTPREDYSYNLFINITGLHIREKDDLHSALNRKNFSHKPITYRKDINDKNFSNEIHLDSDYAQNTNTYEQMISLSYDFVKRKNENSIQLLEYLMD